MLEIYTAGYISNSFSPFILTCLVLCERVDVWTVYVEATGVVPQDAYTSLWTGLSLCWGSLSRSGWLLAASGRCVPPRPALYVFSQ